MIPRVRGGFSNLGDLTIQDLQSAAVQGDCAYGVNPDGSCIAGNTNILNLGLPAGTSMTGFLILGIGIFALFLLRNK